MNLIIRSENNRDIEAITNIHNMAFEQRDEGILVERLRQNSEFAPELSLVAETDGSIIGHILFYTIAIDSDGKEFESLALGPMGVFPGFQNTGIGSKLVTEGLSKAKQLGYKSVIVLGHANYYPRFGFQSASKWGIKPPFEAPDEAFMALELTPDELSNKQGIVKYPKEFEDI